MGIRSSRRSSFARGVSESLRDRYQCFPNSSCYVGLKRTTPSAQNVRLVVALAKARCSLRCSPNQPPLPPSYCPRHLWWYILMFAVLGDRRECQGVGDDSAGLRFCCPPKSFAEVGSLNEMPRVLASYGLGFQPHLPHLCFLLKLRSDQTS